MFRSPPSSVYSLLSSLFSLLSSLFSSSLLLSSSLSLSFLVQHTIIHMTGTNLFSPMPQLWTGHTIRPFRPSLKGLATMDAHSRNKCIATRNKCLTSSNKKLLGTRASLLGTTKNDTSRRSEKDPRRAPHPRRLSFQTPPIFRG